MIFIGYSSKDRERVVEPILFHLKHYGYSVWYDFYDMFLGDNRYHVNFAEGIESSNYAIFIISSNFFSSLCAQEELQFAHDIVNRGKIVLFPLFYHYSPQTIPNDYLWVTNTIYNEIEEDSGTIYAANQIVERIVKDEIKLLPYKYVQDFKKLCMSHNDYWSQLITTWESIDERNYGMRMGILHSLYLSLSEQYSLRCEKAINYILKQIQIGKTVDHLIYSIYEKNLIVYLNYFIQQRETEY